PERRARGQGEEWRELRQQPVDDPDCLVRFVDRDVDVHAEDELAPGHVLELVDERPVAVSGSDPLALEQAERVRARGADAQPLRACHAADVSAELAELLVYVGRGAADGCGDLEHRLHQLGVHLRLELVTLDRREHRVDVLDEVEGLAVEDHVLLLDTERVRVAGAEAMVEHAAGVEGSFARNRRRDELTVTHGSDASASISTFQAGSSSCVTTAVEAGRISPKISPCARATSL